MLRHYAELALYKAWADLRAETSRTYLGLLWWVFEPLMYLAVFWVVRGTIMGRTEGDLVQFLLIGIVAFQWLRRCVGMSLDAILAGKGLMLRVHLPKAIFPFARLLTSTFKFAFLFVLLLVFLWLSGLPPGVAYVALPALLVVQFLLLCAISLVGAAIVPLFPDLRFVIDNLLLAAFWLSGVFFTVDRLPAEVQAYFYFNPMACLIEDYRNVLMYDVWPDWGALGIIALGSCAGLAAGLWLIRRFEHIYPKITQ